VNKLKKSMPKILVIGGGATGCGVARDLVLRGYQTTLIESGNLGSGTSSRSHGMLQSGARYAVTETSFAAECYQERNIISKIFPKAVELIGGLFISLPNDPEDYPEKFLKGCKIAKIPTKEIEISEVLKHEKELTKNILMHQVHETLLIYF
jgi:glycerol-3-phosphate dehydrogenase